MSTRIVLLRGINVGKAKRVPMAELRELMESLGFRNVRTLLNTGNVVFESDDVSLEDLERGIQSAIADRFGFDVPTMVITPAILQQVIERNPLVDMIDNPSRFLIAFLGRDAKREQLAEIADLVKPPEAFALDEHAAYLWCPEGISKCDAAEVLLRPIHGRLTTRNLVTTLKLRELAK